MHRTLTTPNTPYLGQLIANPPYVVDYDDPYQALAEHIAGSDNHLAELVGLMTAIQRAGVDLVEHWDCLTAELVLGEMERTSNK